MCKIHEWLFGLSAIWSLYLHVSSVWLLFYRVAKNEPTFVNIKQFLKYTTRTRIHFKNTMGVVTMLRSVQKLYHWSMFFFVGRGLTDSCSNEVHTKSTYIKYHLKWKYFKGWTWRFDLTWLKKMKTRQTWEKSFSSESLFHHIFC